MNRTIVFVKLCLALLTISVLGCNTVSFRAAAQGAVRTMAHAVQVADKFCASAIRKQLAGEHTMQFAQTCVTGYRTARAALIVSEDAIDAATETRVVCALARSVDALLVLRDAVSQFAQPPKEVSDALELAKWASSLAATKCEGEASK